jgi:hypothetical protein
MARIIALDSDTGTVTRAVYEDNGRGSLVTTGENVTHSVTCRVSYESGGVWHRGEWVGGLATQATPYVLANRDADIKAQDTLEWRGRRYTVGPVTFPGLGGGAVCLQAPLTAIEEAE